MYTPPIPTESRQPLPMRKGIAPARSATVTRNMAAPDRRLKERRKQQVSIEFSDRRGRDRRFKRQPALNNALRNTATESPQRLADKRKGRLIDIRA